MKLFDKEFTRREIMQRVGDISQIGGVMEYTLKTGRAKGVSAVEINTGTGLRFTVLPDRCMDIAWAEYKGIPLSWISKTGVTAPEYFEHKGFEWLRDFFGGLLTTCGLRSTGVPNECEGEEFGLHGRIANIPAENVSICAEWEGDNYVMTIKGHMRECRVFGENLLLKREIKARLGESRLTIKDTVINQGFKPEDIAVLYHFNFGFPLVDDQARINVPNGKITAASEEAEKGIGNFSVLHNSVIDCKEQCFFFDFDQEDISVGIENPLLSLCNGIYIKYRKPQLPRFVIWKMLGQSEYVVGLEPGTAYPMGRSKAKEEGHLLTLQPFEEYTAEIEIVIKEKSKGVG